MPDGDILQGFCYETCLVYMEDITIVRCTFEDHLSNLWKALEKLRKSNGKLNPSKFKLFFSEVSYLKT